MKQNMRKNQRFCRIEEYKILPLLQRLLQGFQWSFAHNLPVFSDMDQDNRMLLHLVNFRSEHYEGNQQTL